MPKLFILFCFLAFSLSCSTSQENKSGTNYRHWMHPTGKLKVLATTAMIEDVAKQIGGEFIETCTLIKGELDPHSYQLVKGDDEKLKIAQLIFYNGLGLEHGPSLHQFLNQSSKAISLGDKIRQQNPALILYNNGQIDPHIWMDIELWSKTLPFIVEALINHLPQQAEYFKKQEADLRASMLKLHEQIRTDLQAIPEKQRFLVTSHDAFNYFTRAYLAEAEELKDASWQKRFAAPEGLAPESQLSTTDIQYIIDYVARHQIHMLFPESNVSKDSIRKIVDAGSEKGLHLKIANEPLYADAMGGPGSNADTYLKMIEYNAHTIAKFLRRNYP